MTNQAIVQYINSFRIKKVHEICSTFFIPEKNLNNSPKGCKTCPIILQNRDPKSGPNKFNVLNNIWVIKRCMF